MSKKNPVRKGSDDVQESPEVAWTNGIVQIILRLVDKLPNESADRLNFGVDILAFLVLFFLGFYQAIPLEQVAPCFFGTLVFVFLCVFGCMLMRMVGGSEKSS